VPDTGPVKHASKSADKSHIERYAGVIPWGGAMPELINPDGLEADAVVPQCLDNQYVSDKIFEDMISRGVDYTDGNVAAAREREFCTEFIRSLVYSSQVVIQRAQLKNSDFLYKNYQPQPQNRENLHAFARLIREHAIIPYLYKESSLTDKTDLKVRDEGDIAVQELLREVGDDVRCVRLAANKGPNERATDVMATKFGDGLARLNGLITEERKAMASELFSDQELLQKDYNWQEFENALDRLYDYASHKIGELRHKNKKITRQIVYQDCFVAGSNEKEREENVALGRFKTPGKDNPFLLSLKKYVDLVYNTNLPDHLKRYTFTPANMPSRMALQDAPGEGFEHEKISAMLKDGEEVLEWARRMFVARTQPAMNLPLLSQLSVADAVAIRQLPEWEPFKDAQQQILKNPLKCLNNMAAFEESFDRFQHALSEWYNITYKRDKTNRRYGSLVSLGLSIGGLLVVARSNLEPMPHDVADFAIPALGTALPQQVKGYAVKLMVGVFDYEQKRLDKDRTYTIELMQTNEELAREDLIDLLRLVNSQSQRALPSAPGQLADQGVK
jgi:hypothetical protein